MQKIVCFGEVLLRMSPELNGAWLQQNSLPVFLGGAELNAGQALSLWGHAVRYVSAMPQNSMSTDIQQQLQIAGIDTAFIHNSGNRIGIYFLPQGTDLKNSGVIYDRAGSSFAGLTTGILDWDSILDGVKWFHFSAISPALSENTAALCEEGLAAAASKGITVSVDMNYRSKLWQYGKAPTEIMPALLTYCDIAMGNIWAAESLLGVPVEADIHDRKTDQAYQVHGRQTALAIMEKFPKVKTVANTFRFDQGVSGIRYFATIDDREKQSVSPVFNTDTVLDKVGSGDCFMAGLIHGISCGYSLEETVRYAAAAAFGKLQEKGDATRQTVEGIRQLAAGYT